MKHTYLFALSAMIGLSASYALAAGDSRATTGSADHSASHAMHANSSAADDTSAMSEGEVRKIDKEAGKLTIKHGELKNLKMPGMTMVFRVKDAAMLDQVKVGDKIHFVADKSGSQFVVTQIKPKN